MTSCVIAVSGLHRGESPQSGGAVIQSIRAALPKARFVGISFDPLETGLYSQGADRIDAAYLFPYPGAGAGQFLDRLREVHAVEKIDLIIPTLDSELENLIALRPQLDEMGIKVAVPSRASFHSRDKAVLGELGKRTGVHVPRTYAAQTAAALATFTAFTGYPCYVKGAIYDAKAVYNEAQLYEAFAAIFAVWGGPVLLQEAVFGEEYIVAGVGDGTGGLIAHCAVRKLLRSRLGKAFGGIVIEDPVVEDLSRRLVADLKWDGPFEIEFIKPAGGQHTLFEINPRFPAWISFPAKIGCNMPAWVSQRALGLRTVKLDRCKAGQMFLRHCEDIVADISDIAELSVEHERHVVRDQ